MKNRMRALLLACSLTLGIFAGSACAQEQTLEVAVEQDSPAQGEAETENTQQVLNDAAAFAIQKVEQLAAMTDEDIEDALETGNDSTRKIIANWQVVREELGEYSSVESQTATQSADKKTITVESLLKYAGVSDATKVINTAVFNTKTGEMTMEFDVRYPKSKLFAEAALNTLMGLGIVFLALLFLSWIIGKIHYIPELIENRSKKADAASPAMTATPAVTRMNAAAEDNIVNDGELIAVIAAAIAAYEGKTVEKVLAEGFVVRSIRKENRENWLRA